MVGTVMLIVGAAALVFLVSLFIVDRGREEPRWLVSTRRRARQDRIEAAQRASAAVEPEKVDRQESERSAIEERLERERARAELADTDR
jgi:hypothetical protein